MEINITYKSPEHEAAFLSELQRIPRIVNPESGRVNPYWGASLYLLSALTRWPERPGLSRLNARSGLPD